MSSGVATVGECRWHDANVRKNARMPAEWCFRWLRMMLVAGCVPCCRKWVGCKSFLIAV